MRWPVAVLVLSVCAAQPQVRVSPPRSPEQWVQDGMGLSPEDAAALEERLAASPEDLGARCKLLGYYFNNWMQAGAEKAREARRRLVLWLIERHPDSTATSMYESIIDPKGHSLADPEGYEKARKMWLAMLEEPTASPVVLGNIAKFLQLNDREAAEKALLRAIQIEPSNGEWQWRLGFLYGSALMGVDALAFNGQPASVNPLELDGPFARKARKALESSTSPLTLAVAGNTIAHFGTMLAPSERARLQHLEDAERLYLRAQKFDPRNPNWQQLIQQTQALKQRMLTSDPDAPQRRQRANP